MKQKQRIHEVWLDTETKVQYFSLELAQMQYKKRGLMLVRQMQVGFEVEVKGLTINPMKVGSRDAVNNILRSL